MSPRCLEAVRNLISHRGAEPEVAKRIDPWACLKPSAPPRPGAAQGEDAREARAHEKGAPSPGARPRADQRFLLGRVYPPLAGRAGAGRRRQSVLLLRPRLDLHRAQHGPVDPFLRNAQRDAGGGGGEDGLRRRAAESVPLPHAGVHRLGNRHAGEAGSGRVRRSLRPAALFLRRRQPDCRRGRRFRAQFARLGRNGEIAVARFSRSTAAWASVPSA